MKMLLTPLTLLLSFPAFSYEGFRCFPSMRETRMQVLVKENLIEVLVVNSMGYDHMPQFDGPSSSFNIAFNKMQSQDLKELADGFTLRWPKEKCQLNAVKYTLNCQGPAENSVKSIEALGVSTTEITEKYETDVYNKRKFRFSVVKDNYYFINLQFDTKSCEKFN